MNRKPLYESIVSLISNTSPLGWGELFHPNGESVKM